MAKQTTPPRTAAKFTQQRLAPVLPSRRRLLANGLRLAAAALLPATVIRAAFAQQAEGGLLTPAAPPAPARPGTWIVLLGTRAGPGIDLARSQTASAVIIDGRPYLVDCGYGTVRQLVASHVGYLNLNTIFFTHLHDDHTGDLPALMSYQWSNGKTSPTDAYGPYGTSSLVAASVAVLRANVEIRTADEGRTVDAQTQFHGHDSAASATPVQMFKDDRLTVTAVENEHYPARSKAKMPHRALALRFDTKDRSVVFSGDTAYSANLVGLAANADVFVCEVIDQAIRDEMLDRAKAAAAAGNENNIFRHVAETHSSPADVARMATQARVKTVVLNHQLAGTVPPGGLAYPTSTFIDAVRRGFSGEVIVGQDLMVL